MIQDFINKQFFSLFVFTLIFGLLLYGTIGFDFIDEICATLLFILFGYSLFKSQEWLINKAFLTTIGVFLFYLCYSLCINSNTKAAIITDFIIQFKPYLALFCVYSLTPFCFDLHRANRPHSAPRSTGRRHRPVCGFVMSLFSHSALTL